MMRIPATAAVYVISVAAELAGMHPQTLRQYDRLGLVTPERTVGRGRRYSAEDIARLQLIQQLSQDDGINLAGIRKILDLQDDLRRVRARARDLEGQVTRLEAEQEPSSRVFAAGSGGDVFSILRGERPRRRTPGSALVVYRPHGRGAARA
ncbi:MerR family transcriptional regulator, heat shock protein HspR [Brevibacterium jeotgali]|uniref:MerR family transcriptional regulator, heat shock protein HspR n=2 Tax=Brevibacterium jeotgali TaxID=1262550 RepID=A0A2H1L2U6_9MICO|nr:MerR family transcriptional regulator/heat shock protein HspR [Brevibacterium jeotgali]SMY10733.1 MerR family transcriptional regulator, heat shock protein HspR [Brevibacterium jeotgali]